MNRTSLWITVLFFAAVVAGIWLYQSTQRTKSSPWDLISSDAVAVIETTNYQGLIRECNSFPILASVLSHHHGLQMLNSISQKAGTILFSFHPISADDFAIMIIAPERSMSPQVIEKYQNETLKSTAASRAYNGSIINEYTYPDGTKLINTHLDDLVLVSSSPILIEGAIRFYNAKNAKVFRSENPVLFQLPSLQTDHGNIYINSNNFEKWLSLFAQPGTSKNFPDQFGDGALVDIKMDSNRVLLNGFITDQANLGIIASFNEQQPINSEIWSYISNKSAFVVEAKFSDRENWLENEDVMFRQNLPDRFREMEERLNSISLKRSELKEMIGPHLVSCFVMKGIDLASVSFLKLNGEIDRLKEIAFQAAEYKGDSVYHEYHAANEIQMIDLPDLFVGITYPFIPAGARTYFTEVGDYLMISEDVELIKLFLDDIDREETWGKSVEWSRYLRTTLQESNINLYFDGKLTSLALREKLNDKWRPFVDTTKLLGVQKGAIQISHLDAVYYLNAVFNLERTRKVKENKQIITRFELEAGLRMSPTVVRNHDSKDLEILLQDSLNNLQLFSDNLKKKWSLKLGSPIQDKISQVDYYRNGKLQYLLATEKELHLIDRLGRSVEKFPVELPTTDILYARVVDYDNSRNYRYLLVNKKGSAFLTDKDGNALEGWNPRPVGNALIDAVEHKRIFGKDYFIAIQGNGTVTLINRKGESIKGFPVSLNARPQGSYAIQRGKDLASSYLVVVSEDGQKIVVDFKGQVTRNDVLPRFSSNARFKLINSIGDDSFIFFSVEGTRLAVIDAKGNLIFEKQNPGSDQWDVGFVMTALKQKVFCLFDKQQNFSYLFNEKGVLLTNGPLESDFMPTLSYDPKSGSLKVYNVEGRTISVIPITLD